MPETLTPLWIVLGVTLGLPLLLIAMFAVVTMIGTLAYGVARLWKRLRGRNEE